MELTFPLKVSAHYTLGGAGHAVVQSEAELLEALKHALALSPVATVTVEQVREVEDTGA